MTLTETCAIMEQQLTSELIGQTFCAAEYINPATYYYWRKHLRSKENPESTNFIPVCIQKPVQQQETNRENLELTYPNGVRLSVSVGCELNLIRELILIL